MSTVLQGKRAHKRGGATPGSPGSRRAPPICILPESQSERAPRPMTAGGGRDSVSEGASRPRAAAAGAGAVSMAEKPILCVGLVCLDIISLVDRYPAEDTDTR